MSTYCIIHDSETCHWHPTEACIFHDTRVRWQNALSKHFGFEPSMDIYSKPGSRVQFAFPKDGHDYQQRTGKEKLREGDIYTVDHIDVWDCSSDLYLVEFPGVAFNTVMFRNVTSGESDG